MLNENVKSSEQIELFSRWRPGVFRETGAELEREHATPEYQARLALEMAAVPSLLLDEVPAIDPATIDPAEYDARPSRLERRALKAQNPGIRYPWDKPKPGDEPTPGIAKERPPWPCGIPIVLRHLADSRRQRWVRTYCRVWACPTCGPVKLGTLCERFDAEWTVIGGVFRVDGLDDVAFNAVKKRIKRARGNYLRVATQSRGIVMFTDIEIAESARLTTKAAIDALRAVVLDRDPARRITTSAGWRKADEEREWEKIDTANRDLDAKDIIRIVRECGGRAFARRNPWTGQVRVEMIIPPEIEAIVHGRLLGGPDGWGG